VISGNISKIKIRDAFILNEQLLIDVPVIYLEAGKNTNFLAQMRFTPTVKKITIKPQ
jgi:hypothetical protein